MTLPTLEWLCQTLKADASVLSGEIPLGPIAIDTRYLKAGDTFWALQGTRDGQDFTAEAFAKGAKAAIVSTDWKRNALHQAFYPRLIGLPDTMRGLTDAAKAWRSRCSYPIVGITGSNGKTSTKDIILHLLGQRLRVEGTRGNLNNHIGVPLTLLTMPTDLNAAIIEMGASHEREIADLCAICRPSHGVVTSISGAHLEGFGTIEIVARAKGELYDFVAEMGTAFVPTDDPRCRNEAADCRTRIGYGFEAAPADWNAEFHRGLDLYFDSTSCASFHFEDIRMTVNVPGRAAALTALAGLTIASHFGISPIECSDLLQKWAGVPGRFEMLRLGNLLIINDSYNANPASMRAALETLSQISVEPRIAVLGDMNELGDESDREHFALGNDLAQYPLNRIILVGERVRLAADAAAKAGAAVCWFREFEQLEAKLPKLIPDRGAVLVKASRSGRLERVVEYLKKALS